MRRYWLRLGAGVLLAGAGCVSGPLRDNPAPVAVTSANSAACQNPVWVWSGPGAYGQVFDLVLDVVDDYFEIDYFASATSRYDGRIETFPRIAPGLEQPWKAGSPDFAGRLLATFQTIRHRASVRIEPAKNGGFFVDVRVVRELEDLEQPIRSTAGAAAFRSDNTVERQFEVIDNTVVDAGWIPIGRDVKLEQVILKRLAAFDSRSFEPPAPARDIKSSSAPQ